MNRGPGLRFVDVIADIERHGVPRSAIARQLGVERSTITRLAHGDHAEPRYSLGVELVRLRDTLAEKPASPLGPGAPRTR